MSTLKEEWENTARGCLQPTLMNFLNTASTFQHDCKISLFSAIAIAIDLEETIPAQNYLIKQGELIFSNLTGSVFGDICLTFAKYKRTNNPISRFFVESTTSEVGCKGGVDDYMTAHYAKRSEIAKQFEWRSDSSITVDIDT